MGGRDYRRREPKKSKKGTQKPPSATVFEPPATIEVVRKGKKEKREE